MALALSIHSSINSWNYFFRGPVDHNLGGKAVIHGYHTLYSVDSHARRGHVRSRMRL